MSTTRYVIIIFVSLCICFFAAIVFMVVSGKIQQYSFRTKQEELAQKLGVMIEDYPRNATFPKNYFYVALKPGMSIEEVHSIVMEYEQVFSCYGTDELYYYFSINDDDALRFMIHYDQEGTLVRMYGEDDDSRTLSKEGCVLGLLNE